MSAILIGFICTLLGCLLIIRYQHTYTKFTVDHDMEAVQKFHNVPVPRIGGLAIFIGLTSALLPRWAENRSVAYFGTALLASALPCFLMGFLEDVTKRIGVKERLTATMVSAGMCGYMLSAWLTNIQLLGIDPLLTIPAVSIIFTCICVGGVANSFNLIDGYHGLSSVVAIIILISISYVAFQVADTEIMVSAFACVGAILGFLIWNYPRGLIFLGDGGAYLIGFWVAELSILLVLRNPSVSKWFPLLLCIYPIFETLFTIYRRLFLKRISPGAPDAGHLHQIIYRRVVRLASGCLLGKNQTHRNAMTAPYLWLLSSIAALPAIVFWKNHVALKICSGLFALMYIWLYWSIVRFKTPKWIIFKD